MTIRWGIIGCGDVTEVKSGPAFRGADGSELVAVMRRSADAARDYAARHAVPRWYDDADALIHDEEVDAVYIATPPGAHLAHALRVAAAGKPCYVEKPMARNHPECRKMVEAFASCGVPLFVAHYRRALPRFLKAKELIDEGRIGRVTGVTYHYASPSHEGLDAADLPWRLIAEQAGGGLFMDLGPHTLDILDFILGPLGDVRGTAANVASAHEVEDSVAMNFATPGGAIGAATWHFASQSREDWMSIIGTGGRVGLSTFGNEPVELHTSSGSETFDLPNRQPIQQPLIQTIVDELLGRGQCPSTGESGARTAAVMDAVLDDYYGGRDDRFWRRPTTWPGRMSRA
ncbi:MAG: Gfo/Idh/MocA family oxidoreductase [Polyangiales bacterium]